MPSIKLDFNDKQSIFGNSKDLAVGILFSLVGFLFLIFFIPKIDFEFISYYLNETQQIEGVVLKKEETNCSINEMDIMKIYYQFRIDNNTFEAYSFSSKSKYRINESFQIQYLVKNPEQSKIVNTSNAPYGFWAFLFILIFPSLGLYLVYKNYKQLKKYTFILNDFEFSTGIQVSIKKTDDEVNDVPIYELIYSYEEYGVQYFNIIETLDPEKYKPSEPLIFSRNDSAQSVLLRQLPYDIIKRIRAIYKN